MRKSIPILTLAALASSAHARSAAPQTSAPDAYNQTFGDPADSMFYNRPKGYLG